MKRIAVLLGVVAIACVVFWRFPLFHIVSANTQPTAAESSEFNAAKFAETFWTEQLLPSLASAPDSAEVVAALREDQDAARKKFGRKNGISRSRLFTFRGEGTVVAGDGWDVGVVLHEGSTTPDIVFATGLLFGNLVRDASGLLQAGNFSNSQHFNDISSELNRIVETRLVSKLKQLRPGQKIQFAACAEIPDDIKEIWPLKAIVLELGAK